MKNLLFSILFSLAVSVPVLAHEGHHDEAKEALGSKGETVSNKAPAMQELRMLLEHLKQPEYIHVLINPLPLYGMMIGTFLLLGGLLLKRGDVQIAALILIAGTGAGTWIVVEYGQKGYDRVHAMSNEDAGPWLEVHMNRAEKAQYLFYGTALLALAGLVAIRKERPSARILIWITMLLSGTCIVAGGWISHAGGQVRHSEFRQGPPPEGSLPEHHHDHSD